MKLVNAFAFATTSMLFTIVDAETSAGLRGGLTESENRDNQQHRRELSVVEPLLSDYSGLKGWIWENHRCNLSVQCYSETYCDAIDTSAQGICRAQIRATGSPCGLNGRHDSCLSGRCASTGTCENRLGDGQSCSHDEDCSSGRCDPDTATCTSDLGYWSGICYEDSNCNENTYYCNPTISSCMPKSSNGAYCTSNSACRSTRCISNRCQDTTTYPVEPNGACEYDTDCKSGVCDTTSNKCQAYRARGETCWEDEHLPLGAGYDYQCSGDLQCANGICTSDPTSAPSPAPSPSPTTGSPTTGSPTACSLNAGLTHNANYIIHKRGASNNFLYMKKSKHNYHVVASSGIHDATDPFLFKAQRISTNNGLEVDLINVGRTKYLGKSNIDKARGYGSRDFNVQLVPNDACTGYYIKNEAGKYMYATTNNAGTIPVNGGTQTSYVVKFSSSTPYLWEIDQY